MSTLVMSLVFYADIQDLEYTSGKTQEIKRCSTTAAKIALLALADHADDNGKGAYPAIGKLQLKTGLSRQGLINTLEALEQAGFILMTGRTHLKTCNYDFNIDGIVELIDLESADNQVLRAIAKVHSAETKVHSVAKKPAKGQRSIPKPSSVKPSLNPEEEEETPATQRDNSALYRAFENATGSMITAWVAEQIDAYLDKPGDREAWLMAAFEETAKNSGRTWGYVAKILAGWERNGFRADTRAKPGKAQAQANQDRLAGIPYFGS